jgi:hypothetical protein
VDKTILVNGLGKPMRNVDVHVVSLNPY